MEDNGMERKWKLFSLPAKVIVIAVLMISAAVFTFSISIVLYMGANGISAEDVKNADTPYEETKSAGTHLWSDVVWLSNEAEIREGFEIDGKYDENAVLDITDIDSGVKETAEHPETSYYLKDLERLWGDPQGTVDTLDGILQEAYYLEGYVEDAAGYSAAVIPSDTAEASEEASDVRDTEQEGNPQIDSSLLYSEQFVYLYRNGRGAETVLPISGVSLADYAAKNTESVSLLDLYTQLRQALLDLSSYHNYRDSRSSYESNVKYLVINTETQAVFSHGYGKNVTAQDFEKIAAQEDVVYSFERKNGVLESDKTANAAQEYLYARLLDRDLVGDNEKAVFAINEKYPYDDDIKWSRNTYEALLPWIYPAIALSIASFVIFAVSFVLATVQAGKNPEDGAVQLQAIDRIPLELELCITAAVASIMILLTGGCVSLMFYTAMSPAKLLLFSAVVSVDAGVFMWQYLSYVRRIKGHYFLKGSICARLWGWLMRTCRYIGKSCRDIYAARSNSGRLLISFCAVILVNLLLIAALGGFGILLALVVDAGVLLWLLRDAAGRQVVKDGLKKISGGDLDFKINLDGMHGDNLEMAECINGMGNGLHAAVQKSMKSERLKADLITNVSHDIKTPLTSIINYVDLLKREKIEDEKIRGYIEVLDSKSQRLKQLTEDLVEASKISSGNVTLEFINLNLKELIQQTNGEFSERFAAKELELVCELPEEPLIIRADGRRVWRIIENLYVNISKYAMPGTRVYVNAKKQGGRVVMVVKNISEHRLNINADELTERFIRGDISRSTEGSGLGLSIAKNLAVLQKGTFDIYLDGDLFKVTVTFPEAEPQQPEETAGEKQGEL